MSEMCYLDKVFKDTNGKIKLYQLTLSDSLFRDIREVVVGEEGLLKYLNNKGFIKDFQLEEGYLKCDPKDTLLATSVIESQLSEEKSKNVEQENSFYRFLDYAIENDCILLDDSLIDCDKYTGLAFTKFKNIRFSQSTMSVYFIINTPEGIANKHIVYLEDGALKFYHFYFGVPAGKATYKNATYVKDIVINNELYYVYQIGELGLYPMEVCTSSSLINKACTAREIQQAILDTVKDYSTILNNTLGEKGSTVEWAGGNGSYESQYGIIFKNSLKRPTKNRRNELIQDVFQNFLGIYPDYQNAFSAVNNSPYYSLCEKAALKILLFISYSGKSPVECLSVAKSVREKFAKEMMYTSMFLYKIRVGCYIQHIRLVDRTQPYLVGSEYDTVTTVEAGYYYGDVFEQAKKLEEF